jgi:hypothetical protein
VDFVYLIGVALLFAALLGMVMGCDRLGARS